MPRCKNTVILAVLALSPLIAAAQTCKTNTIPASTPTDRFKINPDSTVTDTRTGLTWQQCPVGQTGAACSGGAASYTWQGALQYAQTLNAGGGFAGFSDWRLPTIKELGSILEEQCFGPAINATVFPNTPLTAAFWSSSPYAKYKYSAWSVHFHDGSNGDASKGDGKYVRLVR